jgi:N-acetylglucosaminyl-diphospho-decaprenol L-rhamnosyltransferase
VSVKTEVEPILALRNCPDDAEGPLRRPSEPARITGVTAVVVTHNSARHLEALGLAFSAGTVVPTRILAVDNASVDDTVDRARAAGFDVLETGVNGGFGAGCNAGLRVAATEFVLFCNPDVRPSRGALERMLDALRSTPTAAIAGAAFREEVDARRFSRITTDVAGFLPNRLQGRVRRFKEKLPVDHGEDHLVVDYAEGAFILCRVAVLRSVEGFDERFFLYCEEEDLSRRLGERGWQTLLVPSAIVSHEGRSSSEGFDGATMAPLRIHSLYCYYRKYHSRGYAEFGRYVIATCVMLDRGYRLLARRPQVYGPRTAIAPFRSTESVRRDQERYADRRVE